MSNEIRNTLMRFQTLRSPQLPSDENKKLLFVKPLATLNGLQTLTDVVKATISIGSKNQKLTAFFKTEKGLIPPPHY